MTKIVQAQPNQSLLDMILTEYGSLEAGMDVAFANDADISNLPLAGSSWTMPTVGSESVDLQGVEYARRDSIIFGTSARENLGFSVVLQPMMHVVPNVTGAPHALGYYSFDLSGEPGFVHAYPLEDMYLANNLLHYESEERYIFVEPDETSLPLAVTPMTDITIPYKLIWTVGFGYMIVWSDLAQPVVTATFRDIEGNQAYSAPVTVLDNLTMNVVGHLIGTISVDVVSATPSVLTLRLTRSHPPISLTNFSTHTMNWLEGALIGLPDPLDPGNPDKTIISLGPGVHTIGLQTDYFYPGGSTQYPSSAFTMVLEVA
jgi:hypothetical protein